MKKNLSRKFIVKALILVSGISGIINKIIPPTSTYKTTLKVKAEQKGRRRKGEHLASQKSSATRKKATKKVAKKGKQKDNLPKCDRNDWNLVLVNSDYECTVTPILAECNGVFVDQRIVDHLLEVFTGARNSGFNLTIISAYRTPEEQRLNLNNKIAQLQANGNGYEQAVELALQVIAKPNFSEHHTGLALDLIDANYSAELTEALADTPALKWLTAHCADYGFILRYPKGKEKITKYAYEPWHFRYVGQEIAQYIMKNDLTLEEFYQLLPEKKNN